MDTIDTGVSTSLTRRVMKSAGWVLGGKLAGRGLEFIRIIILARLLTPDDFGLLGVAMLALAAIETFSHTGFNKALIQRKGNITDHLNTAWTIQIIRGLVLCVALFSAAPLVAWFFDEPRAILILQVLSLTEILRGGVNIGIIHFHRNLDFHKQVLYETLSSAIALCIGIILAYQWRNVWALVWAGLAGELSKLILSYVLHPFRPRPAMKRQHARQLFGFGKWMFGVTILNFLATKANLMILGRILGTTALGFFNIANRIGGKLPEEFRHMTDSVMVPAYARVQDDRDRVERGFLASFEATLWITGIAAAMLLVTAPELVATVLGHQWAPATVPLQILAVAGFANGINGASAALNIGLGYPNISFWRGMAGSITVLALIFPLTLRYGIPGAALATACSALAKLPFLFVTTKLANISLKKTGIHAIAGVVLTLSAGMGALAGKPISGDPMVSLLAQLIGGGVLTLASMYLLGRRDLGPWRAAKRALHRLKSTPTVKPASV